MHLRLNIGFLKFSECFIVIDATQAWGDEAGQVVSFTNLQVSQVRDPLGGATGEPGAAAGGEPLTFAQLTLANGAYAAGGTARAELQGRSLFGDDWSGYAVNWQW